MYKTMHREHPPSSPILTVQRTHEVVVDADTTNCSKVSGKYAQASSDISS